jgi:hypothetical protein
MRGLVKREKQVVATAKVLFDIIEKKKELAIEERQRIS